VNRKDWNRVGKNRSEAFQILLHRRGIRCGLNAVKPNIKYIEHLLSNVDFFGS
jgi:hypothetical protein